MNRKIIGIIFTIVYAYLALSLAALMSVHGPDFILHFSAGFLMVAIAALWSIYFLITRRNFRYNTVIFCLSGLGIGLLLLGTIIASWEPLLDWEIRGQEERAAKTEVLNMRDEVLLSSQGNPIGFRLTYSMRFPDSNYFAHSPFVSPEKYIGSGIWANMRMANRSIEPPMIGTDPMRYEQGKTYDFTVDMLPYFVIQKGDKQCILQPRKEEAVAFQELLQSSERVHFIISISGTQFRGMTTNTYSLKEFYDSAIKEGAFDCTPWGGYPPRPPVRPTARPPAPRSP